MVTGAGSGDPRFGRRRSRVEQVDPSTGRATPGDTESLGSVSTGSVSTGSPSLGSASKDSASGASASRSRSAAAKLAPVTYLRPIDRLLNAPDDDDDDDAESAEWHDPGPAGATCDDLYARYPQDRSGDHATDGTRARDDSTAPASGGTGRGTVVDRDAGSAGVAGWTVPGIDYAMVRERAERAGGARRGNHPAGSAMRTHGVDDEAGATSGSGGDAAAAVSRSGAAASGSGSGATASGSSSGARKERRAEKVSMAALTRRNMSRWEIEKTLTSRELEPDVIAAELERLESVGLIDDAMLADTIVRTQHDRKGLGRSALIAELRRRHIDQEHIDLAMEQIDGDDELDTARGLAERRARQLTSLDRETAVRRLTGYLMRKGYSSSVVRTAVDEALSGHGGGSGGVRFR